MENRNVVILGGYGNFGKRIAESLLDIKGITLLIAGRSKEKATELCELWSNKKPNALLKPIAPSFWLHPFGPVTKNIPILVLIWIYYTPIKKVSA